jgi:hypothetical protein
MLFTTVVFPEPVPPAIPITSIKFYFLQIYRNSSIRALSFVNLNNFFEFNQSLEIPKI